MFIADAAGNTRILDTDAIAARGFPTDLEVPSAVDDTPPELVALAFAPDFIDATAAAAEVVMNFTATDDLAGVKCLELTLVSPSESETRLATANLTPANKVRGSAVFNLSQFSEAGVWTLNSAFLANRIQRYTVGSEHGHGRFHIDSELSSDRRIFQV